MKQAIYKILSFIFRFFPLNKIIFESRPDCSDNTKAVFDEMVKRGLNKKYKFVWICRGDIAKYPTIENVTYFKPKKGKVQGFLFLLKLATAKCVICCNGYTISKNSHTVNVYLDHGNPLKNTSAYYAIPKEFDVINNSSEGMKSVKKKLFGLTDEQMTVWGHPRNDVLTEVPVDLHPLFEKSFKKIIVWYPTVRQFAARQGNFSDSTHALPVVWDEEKAVEINNYAKEKDVLIVLKPHFAQDVSKFKALSLSNLIFIDESFFKDNDITSYRFVGSCDALITDYSSIYYDFTLCDKPIGLTWEDYEEYARNPGFAVDMDYVMKGGIKIYTIEDFKAFLDEVAQGIDSLQNERREIRDFANAYADGKSAMRAVDEIAQRAKL